jgi:hypothetical protein
LGRDRGPSHQRRDTVRACFEDFVDLRFIGEEVGSRLIGRCQILEAGGVHELQDIQILRDLAEQHGCGNCVELTAMTFM